MGNSAPHLPFMYVHCAVIAAVEASRANEAVRDPDHTRVVKSVRKAGMVATA